MAKSDTFIPCALLMCNYRALALFWEFCVKIMNSSYLTCLSSLNGLTLDLNSDELAASLIGAKIRMSDATLKEVQLLNVKEYNFAFAPPQFYDAWLFTLTSTIICEHR